MPAPSVMSRPRTRLPADVQVERHVTRPGEVVLEAVDTHRIKVHTGRAVTGECGAHRFRYAHGDVDLLPAGSHDSWQEDGPGTSVIVHFAPALFARTAEALGVDAQHAGLPMRHQFRDVRIAHLAWALDADHRAGQPSGRLYTDSLSTALLAHLAAQHRVVQPVTRGLPRARLQRLTDYIEAHLDQDLSLARLADVANLSASHLKAQFKHAMGLPVHAYVIRRRVERARALLARGELPASQVALEAGFAHQSHMVRSLRRVLGETSASLLRRRAA